MADYTLSAKITGDASGFKGAIASAQASIDQLQTKVSSAGKKMQSIGKDISSVGDSLTKYITKPAILAKGALVSVALVKGFDRLTGIDDARAKLMGLGHDAESVDKIMQSASTSVKGTSFGMAEAATTAAGAVAAGVKQGDELTRYLSLTADAAAIAGTSMSEMGSIVNKVTTSGRAMTENLEQLSDRGLPIYQWLGDAAGVAASEIKDMASDGKISSEMFLEAIEKNIGGAAQIMGHNSFKSTIANIGASIGRIGANFLDAGGKGGGFFSTLKPMLADFNTKLGVVEDQAAELGVKFGESFQKVISIAQSLKEKFDSLSPPIQQIISKGALIGTGIAVGIGPALKVVGMLTSSLGGVITVLGAFISPIGLVVAAVIGFGVAIGVAMAKSESFRNKVIGIGQSVGETLQMVKLLAQGFLTMVSGGTGEQINALKEKFYSLFPEDIWNRMSMVTVGINSVISVLKTLIGIISGSVGDVDALWASLAGVLNEDHGEKLFEIGTKIKASLETAKEAVSSFGSTISPIISTAFSNIGPLISSALSGIVPLISSVFNGLKEVVSTVWPIIQGFISGFTNGFSSMSGNAGSSILQIIGFIKMFSSPLGIVMKLLQEFGPQIVSAFSEVGTMLIPLFTNLGQTLGNLAASVIPILATAISTLMPVIMQIASTVGNIIMTVLPVIIQLMTQLLPIISQIIEVVVQLAAALMPIIADLVSTLLPVIMNIISALMNIVTAVAPILISIIQTIITIIQALIPVITSIISVVANVVSNVITAVSMVITIVANVIATIISIISPIITFIAGVISSIIAAISPVIAAVSGVFSTVFSIISDVWNNVMNTVSTVINAIGGVISGLSSVVSGVFNTIFSTISSIMNNVSTTISGVFDAIKNSWTGLTTFVSGVFDGISSAVESLVNQVKGFVNGVIGGVNSAIGIINKIPGVSIGAIPYLQSGTSSWQGGFARMNEGGRGEMVLLPSGSQVIPHDVSMQYAKESAKRNSSNQLFDISSKEETKQPINIYITNEGNEEFIRTYVNTENAIDDTIRIFT